MRRAWVCSDILAVGYLLRSSHAEASGAASRHKRRPGEARCCMLARRCSVGHGRCALGTRKAIIYRSEKAEKGGNVNTELL